MKRSKSNNISDSCGRSIQQPWSLLLLEATAFVSATTAVSVIEKTSASNWAMLKYCSTLKVYLQFEG